MPIWFVLLICCIFLVVPGGLDGYFTYGTKRWHMLFLLGSMAIFGFHEQWSILSTLHINFGGVLIPFLFFFFVLFRMPKAQRNHSILCICMGAIGAYVAAYTLSSWADGLLHSSDYLIGAVMLVYVFAFSARPMQCLTCFTLGYLLSGFLGYVDERLTKPSALCLYGGGRAFPSTCNGWIFGLFPTHRGKDSQIPHPASIPSGAAASWMRGTASTMGTMAERSR